MQRLFVYGTLAPGRTNYKVLENIPGSWEAATLRGVLHQEGWGIEMGCPGIIPTEDGDEVEGSSFHQHIWKINGQCLMILKVKVTSAC